MEMGLVEVLLSLSNVLVVLEQRPVLLQVEVDSYIALAQDQLMYAIVVMHFLKDILVLLECYLVVLVLLAKLQDINALQDILYLERHALEGQILQVILALEWEL
jgi:hypothetical protein